MLVALVLVVAAVGVEAATAIEPVRHKWTRSEIMDANGLYLLEWKVDHKDIVFTVTVNTRGFIGLGFSHKSERMSGSDLVLAWVDDRTGKPSVLVSLLNFNYFIPDFVYHKQGHPITKSKFCKLKIQLKFVVYFIFKAAESTVPCLKYILLCAF